MPDRTSKPPSPDLFTDLLTCEATFVQAADASLKTLHTAWRKDLSSCLPGFAPTSEHERISCGTKKWVELIVAGWCTMLAPILQESVDRTELEAWVRTTSDKRATLTAAWEGVAECRQMFAPVADLIAASEQACEKN